MAAFEAGYGGFWCGRLTQALRESAELRTAAGISEGLEVQATLCLGVPDVAYKRAVPHGDVQVEFD